jgi:hypothetical protein
MSSGVVNAAAVQSVKAPDITLSGATSMQRKCACGNHSNGGDCTNCAKKKLQRKLSIGSTTDPLELEADRVAEQVLANGPTHSFSKLSAPGIQRRAEPSAAQSDEQSEAAPASVENVLAGSGSPLPAVIREDMEQRFGQNFSHVRMHTGRAAEQSAREINANAYTVGNNIVFNSGKFSPSTHEGKRLLAHELTHVVQQSGQTGSDITQGVPVIRRSSAPNKILRSASGNAPQTNGNAPTSQIVQIDNNVIAEIGKGNAAVAQALRQLCATPGVTVQIDRGVYTAETTSPGPQVSEDEVAARKLLIESLNIKVTTVSFAQRAQTYADFAQDGGSFGKYGAPEVSKKMQKGFDDLPHVASARASGAQIWSFDNLVKENATKLGMTVFPGSNLPTIQNVPSSANNIKQLVPEVVTAANKAAAATPQTTPQTTPPPTAAAPAAATPPPASAAQPIPPPPDWLTAKQPVRPAAPAAVVATNDPRLVGHLYSPNLEQEYRNQQLLRRYSQAGLEMLEAKEAKEPLSDEEQKIKATLTAQVAAAQARVLQARKDADMLKSPATTPQQIQEMLARRGVAVPVAPQTHATGSDLLDPARGAANADFNRRYAASKKAYDTFGDDADAILPPELRLTPAERKAGKALVDQQSGWNLDDKGFTKKSATAVSKTHIDGSGMPVAVTDTKSATTAIGFGTASRATSDKRSSVSGDTSITSDKQRAASVDLIKGEASVSKGKATEFTDESGTTKFSDKTTYSAGLSGITRTRDESTQVDSKLDSTSRSFGLSRSPGQLGLSAGETIKSGTVIGPADAQKNG